MEPVPFELAAPIGGALVAAIGVLFAKYDGAMNKRSEENVARAQADIKLASAIEAINASVQENTRTLADLRVARSRDAD